MLLGPITGIAVYIVLSINKNKPPDELTSYQKHIFQSFSFSLIRCVLTSTFIAAALFAPLRGLAFLVTKYSNFTFIDEMFSHMSLNGMVDSWMGLIGVVFTIPAGYAAWRQGLRMKTQIENIPTSTTHSAALGLAEFKGIAVAIEDAQVRMTEIIGNGKKLDSLPAELGNDPAATPILYQRWIKKTRGSDVTQIRSRFYLKDDSGQILVDPRSVAFWDGKVQYLAPAARSVYLGNRLEETQLNNKEITIRRLDSGDEIYLIGSVEVQEAAPPWANGVDRLVVRPSSAMISTNILIRIILGRGRKSRRTDIHDVFLLTDLTEIDAANLLFKGIGTIWLWVGIIVCLSVPMMVEYWEMLFSWQKLRTMMSLDF